MSAVVRSPMDQPSEIMMRKDTCSHTQGCVFDYARLVAWMRETYPHNTAKQVALALDLPTRTVENWLNGRAKPNAAAVFAMIGTWGLDFLAQILPAAPDWLDRAKRAEQLQLMQAEQARLNAEIAALTARAACSE